MIYDYNKWLIILTVITLNSFTWSWKSLEKYMSVKVKKKSAKKKRLFIFYLQKNFYLSFSLNYFPNEDNYLCILPAYFNKKQFLTNWHNDKKNKNWFLKYTLKFAGLLPDKVSRIPERSNWRTCSLTWMSWEDQVSLLRWSRDRPCSRLNKLMDISQVQ